MRYAEFGKTSWKVSVIGHGCWQAGMNSWGSDYSYSDASEAIKTSISNGVNFFDTAEIYGMGLSERILGEASKNQEIFIADKVAGYNVERIEKSLLRSEKNLGRGIDLYQLHWAPSLYTNLGKTVKNMESLVRKGKVPYIGLSNFPTDLLIKASEYLSREEFVSNQVQYSLVDRRIENSLVPTMNKMGMKVIAYSPLGRGKLTGKYFDARMPSNLARLAFTRRSRSSPSEALKGTLEKISSERRMPISSVSLGWVIARNAIPIPGSKRPAQALDNIKSADLKLGKEDLDSLNHHSHRALRGEYPSLVPRALPNRLVRILFEGFT